MISRVVFISSGQSGPPLHKGDFARSKAWKQSCRAHQDRRRPLPSVCDIAVASDRSGSPSSGLSPQCSADDTSNADDFDGHWAGFW